MGGVRIRNIAIDAWNRRVVERKQNDDCEMEFIAGVEVGFRACKEMIALEIEKLARWFAGKYMTAINMDTWLSWFAQRVRELGEEVKDYEKDEETDKKENK